MGVIGDVSDFVITTCTVFDILIGRPTKRHFQL